MDVSSIVSKNVMLGSILGRLKTEDLFTCAEVYRVGRSVALCLLERKLISVSVCCMQDLEELHAIPPQPSKHSCADRLRNKFSRFRKIYRMADMLPSLVFISSQGDLGKDKSVWERLRELLASNCAAVHFSLDLVCGPDDDSATSLYEGSYDGTSGKLLFSPEAINFVCSSLEYADGCEGQQKKQDDHETLGRSSLNLEELAADSGELPATASPVAAVVDADDPPAGERVPPDDSPQRLVWLLPPSMGRDDSGRFQNVLPGVLMVQALHVTDSSVDGKADNCQFVEKVTRQSMQVEPQYISVADD